MSFMYLVDKVESPLIRSSNLLIQPMANYGAGGLPIARPSVHLFVETVVCEKDNITANDTKLYVRLAIDWWFVVPTRIEQFRTILDGYI